MHYIIYYEKWVEQKKNSRNFLCKIIKRSINRTQNISHWLLEIDESGRVKKEISIGFYGEVLSSAPRSGNRGEWVDSNILINPVEYEKVEYEIFQEYWNNR